MKTTGISTSSMKGSAKARLASFAFGLCFALSAASPALAEGPKAHGLELVPWSKKLEADRFQSSRDWEGTLKYFKDKFRGWKGIRWHREVNLPTVKYIHIENLNPKAPWAGVNVYQLPSGQVRMYVLERVKEEDAKEEDRPGPKTARASAEPASDKTPSND